jgi:iron complex outermembrane receptor protein
MATNRTDNSAGAIYDENWNVVDYYDNEVDNYGQDHYQLHLNQILNERFKLNVSLHYTKGSGYYEQYKQDAFMPAYGINPVINGTDTISTTDLVRQKWLDNDFYGAIFNLEYSNSFMTSILGGGINQYDGDHFGEILWARYASQTQPGEQYYNSTSSKSDANIYWKNLIDINDRVTAFADLQVRSVKYAASGADDDVGAFSFSQNNVFFNPKAGVTYRVNQKDKVFISYAVGHKEPNRTDLIYADPNDLPRPEKLQDFEFGYEYGSENFSFMGNAFYMFYTDQLVLTGQLDNVGYPIRKNIGKSYRIGVELAMSWQPLEWLKWSPNVAYIQSQNLDYVEESGNGEVKALGNTSIAYSPNTVFSSTLEFYPIKGLTLGVFSQYVSRQYLNNSQVDRLSLDSYFLNSIRVAYDLRPSWIGKIRLYASVNNAFNAMYANNGYVWGTTPYYYPQAGINFLGGIELSF